ncbi:MAG: cell division protein FtsL [Rhodocyclaceae bacterium]|nr:cell division protein FtsL [Rhodocyclaceae bacterium]
MIRWNLILLAAVLISALADVSINHRARKLVTSYEREQERMRALEVEWGQLQLEQSTWATHARIEEIARRRLGMNTPRTNQIITASP